MSTSEQSRQGLTQLHKLPMEDMIAALVDYHSRFDDRMDEVKKAMAFITDFLNEEWKNKVTPKDSAGTTIEFKTLKEETQWFQTRYPVIYPYAKANQKDFEENMTVLELSLSAVLTVVKDLNKELYKLSNPAPVPQMPGNGTPITINTAPPQKTERHGFLGLGGSKPLLNVTDITPYARSVDVIDEVKQIPVLLQKVKDYHLHGKSRSHGLHMGKYIPQEFYLIEEDQEFHKTVKPRLLMIIQAAQEIYIKEEKVVISAVLTRALDDHSRAEMAMPPGQTA
jgi:hypothetical protein